MPWIKAPVRASIRINAVVAGEGQGQGWGVAVAGPHEDCQEPVSSIAQTGVVASTTRPP
jgi:hypothetical protein